MMRTSAPYVTCPSKEPAQSRQRSAQLILRMSRHMELLEFGQNRHALCGDTEATNWINRNRCDRVAVLLELGNSSARCEILQTGFAINMA